MFLLRGRVWKLGVVGGLMILAVFQPIRGNAQGLRDLPSRLGRLFRPEPRPAPSPSRIPFNPGRITPVPSVGNPAVSTPPTASGSAPRLVPQPRVTRPITDADPLLTRIALARSDHGSRFGMFLQVFRDGTVLDSEGVHRVGPDVIRGLSQAIVSGDLLRRGGHCGGPSTDFIEQYHVTVYERSGRTLRASTFTYTPNMQGSCDSSVERLHQALEALVLKIAPQPAAAAASTTTAPPRIEPVSPPPSLAPAAPSLEPLTEPSPSQPVDPPPLLPPITAPSPTSIPLTPLPEE